MAAVKHNNNLFIYFYFLILMATSFAHPDNHLPILLEIILSYMQYM